MIKVIVIIPTYRCNFSCLHCGVKKSRKKQYISLSKVKKLFKSIKTKNISNVTLTGGGEPSIDFEKTVRIIKLAIKYGFHSQINTNASFVLKNRGRDNMKILKEAGLETINFSIDVHHLKFISYGSIIKAIRSALKSNLNVRIGMVTTNEAKQKNFVILKKLVKDLQGKLIKFFPFHVFGLPTFYIIRLKRKSIIVNIGRAIKTGFNNKISPSNFRKEKLKRLIFTSCPFPFFIILVTPEGDILPCCRFQCINNPIVYRTDNLNKVKGNREIRTHTPILKEIIFNRFGFLKLFLRIRRDEKLRKQFFKKDFYSTCDLCLLILKHKNAVLKASEPSGPEILFFIFCNFPYFLLVFLKRVICFILTFLLEHLLLRPYS